MPDLSCSSDADCSGFRAVPGRIKARFAGTVLVGSPAEFGRLIADEAETRRLRPGGLVGG
jgi:hypothetical protein